MQLYNNIALRISRCQVLVPGDGMGTGRRYLLLDQLEVKSA